jgi:gp32 DNA binding protein like
MAKKSLADLAATFNTKNSENSNSDASWKKFFPFWKGEVDSTSTFRFLPDLDENNNLAFLVENLVHELVVNGKKEKVACLKMYGEDCPICNLSADYYNEKSPNHNEALGKKYYRKKSYIGQGIVIETEIEHDHDQLVKLIEFGPQVFKQIQAAFKSGDMEEVPYDLEAGYNFRFRKTVTGGGQNSYTTSNFAPKQTSLGADVIDQLELYNLADFRAPKVDRATVEMMLAADQTGSTFAGGDEAETSPAETSSVSTVEESAPVATTPAASCASGCSKGRFRRVKHSGGQTAPHY